MTATHPDAWALRSASDKGLRAQVTINEWPERSRRAWLDSHPRFHVHFVPTSSSWLNMVEGVFADLTKRRLRRGAFVSVDALVEAILGYLDHRNQERKPFIWTASVAQILAKLRDCER